MSQILIIDCGSTKVPLFESTLKSFSQNCTIVRLSDFKVSSLPAYSGIIISGAPILVTEIDTAPYLEQFSFLKEYTNPVLGVCFGHQILGMTYGASSLTCEPARTDQMVIKEMESPLFEGISEFIFNQDHCEAISIPDDWNLLASSSICTNEAMEHPSKLLYGVQFHPETSGENGLRLLKNFCKSC
ncbi:MAG: GMP synthase (glutamine-hydrolyzing) [Parvicellaceae bacterium]|jgi:GMP synthase (glutamine-hydrolysing)